MRAKDIMNLPEPQRSLQGLRNEILAGKVLLPKNEADLAWNNCADRALRIIDSYIAGKGLFQL